MQLSGFAALALALLAAAPASACGIALNTPGTLAPSADYTRLGSDELGGLPATFTVSNGILGGDFTVTVAAPVLAAAPAGFDGGAAQLAVSYAGTGLLTSVSQAYTGATTHFDVSGLLGALAVVMTINNRISTASGFASGTYQTRTVVTCS